MKRVLRRPIPLALSLLALGLCALVTQAQWPQWRGVDGAGVATAEAPLPTEWSADSDNVRWVTEIPGEGTSSPIVSDGRVFVTTAYEGQRFAQMRLLVAVSSAIVALAFAFWVWRRRAIEPAAATFRGRMVIGFSLVFALLAILITAQPELFYSEGNPGRAWRTCGAVALIGLAVAFGWFRPGSAGRLVGAGVLLAAAGYVVFGMPHSPLGPVPMDKRLTFAAPGLIAAIAFAVNFFRARRRAASDRYSPWLALPPLLLALLVFIPPNHLGGLLRVVVCLDFETGELLWETPVLAAPAEQKWPRSSYATPTAATDGEIVVAYFGAGVGALDRDGDLLWVRRFPEYSRHTRYGAGSSPLIVDGMVVVVQESEAFQDGPPSWIAAFDRTSGETLWRVDSETHDSYGTPLVFASPVGPQMIHATWKSLRAWSLTDGAGLWSVDYPMWQLVASLARSGDTIAVTGGAYGDKRLMAMRLPEDLSGPPELLWKTDKRVASIASPVIYDGLLFTVTDGGIMSCYDLETGEEQWKQRLDGEFYASLVAGDGKVYALATDGSTRVIAASRQFELLADNELGSSSVTSSPALADGAIVIRTAAGVHRIDADSDAPAP